MGGSKLTYAILKEKLSSALFPVVAVGEHVDDIPHADSPLNAGGGGTALCL